MGIQGLKRIIAVIRGDSEYDYNYLQGTLWTLDTPLSFIGDTLMLPVDYFHGPWINSLQKINIYYKMVFIHYEFYFTCGRNVTKSLFLSGSE